MGGRSPAAKESAIHVLIAFQAWTDYRVCWREGVPGSKSILQLYALEGGIDKAKSLLKTFRPRCSGLDGIGVPVVKTV